MGEVWRFYTFLHSDGSFLCRELLSLQTSIFVRWLQLNKNRSSGCICHHRSFSPPLEFFAGSIKRQVCEGQKVRKGQNLRHSKDEGRQGIIWIIWGPSKLIYIYIKLGSRKSEPKAIDDNWRIETCWAQRGTQSTIDYQPMRNTCH